MVNGSVGEPAPQRSRSGASNEAIYVGRLEPEKGIERLLSEFALLLQEVPSARLHVLGDGSLRDAVARAAAEIGEPVVLRGPVSPEEAMRAICGAAFAVVPSLWPEPFGLIGPEAFACGVPVVGSGRGGMADWLKHEANGLIADPTSPGELASAMKRLLTESQSHAALPGRSLSLGPPVQRSGSCQGVGSCVRGGPPTSLGPRACG